MKYKVNMILYVTLGGVSDSFMYIMLTRSQVCEVISINMIIY